MKKLISIVLIMCIIFLVFSKIKVYASDNTPTVTTDIWNGVTDQYIGVKFSIDNLDRNVSYEYAILGDNSEPTENDWKTLYFSSDESNNLAVIKYSIDDILKTKEYAYLSVRSKIYTDDQIEKKIIINKEKCNLPLPDFLGKRIIISTGILGLDISFKPIFDITKGQYQYVKITDNNIIEKYKEYKKNEKDSTLNELKNMIPTESEVPLSGWNDFVTKQEYDIPKENGFFYVWTKAQEGNSRSLVGLNIIEVTNNRDKNKDEQINNNTSNNSNTDKKNTDLIDNTISKSSKLPNTGIKLATLILVVLVIVIAIILKIKSNKYNEIK